MICLVLDTFCVFGGGTMGEFTVFALSYLVSAALIAGFMQYTTLATKSTSVFLEVKINECFVIVIPKTFKFQKYQNSKRKNI